MSADQIAWVTLNLEFPDEVEARLENRALEEGLSLKCYCIRVLLRHLLKDASIEQKERWLLEVPVTLLRNGCDEKPPL